jgi:xanthine dehydrogenase YagS FAD-binding subunit
MRPFTYQRADSAVQAVRAVLVANTPPDVAPTESPGQYIAGGTTILDLMKLDVMRPQMLVDISNLAVPGSAIEVNKDGVRFAPLVRMAEAAEHPAIARDYPLIAETLVLAASPQLRNMATLGGNVLQRTRCLYFRDTAWAACNKRDPGSGCAALEGVNRQHAVLGTSDHCIATYPGDFAQALVALDAQIDVTGAGGARTFAFEKLHKQPGTTPHLETVLAPGDLITAIRVPAGPWTRRSLYLKIRDRESYQFALASAAVALDLHDNSVKECRLALGGVATVPWRAREAEALLKGKRLDEDSARAAAEAAFAGARAREHNAFKISLGKQTVVRALLQAQRMEVSNV